MGSVEMPDQWTAAILKIGRLQILGALVIGDFKAIAAAKDSISSGSMPKRHCSPALDTVFVSLYSP